MIKISSDYSKLQGLLSKIDLLLLERSTMDRDYQNYIKEIRQKVVVRLQQEEAKHIVNRVS